MAAHELFDTAISMMNHKQLLQHDINGNVQDALMAKLQELPFELWTLLYAETNQPTLSEQFS